MNTETEEENEALYVVWLRRVSEELNARTGCMTAADFPHYDYRTAFDRGDGADEAAGEIMDNAAQYR
jgi:hypothetical protein